MDSISAPRIMEFIAPPLSTDNAVALFLELSVRERTLSSVPPEERELLRMLTRRLTIDAGPAMIIATEQPE